MQLLRDNLTLWTSDMQEGEFTIFPNSLYQTPLTCRRDQEGGCRGAKGGGCCSSRLNIGRIRSDIAFLGILRYPTLSFKFPPSPSCLTYSVPRKPCAFVYDEVISEVSFAFSVRFRWLWRPQWLVKANTPGETHWSIYFLHAFSLVPSTLYLANTDLQLDVGIPSDCSVGAKCKQGPGGDAFPGV